MKLLGTLGFDWKIFLIQGLNFLILFFILKKIFFNPFITALKKEKEKSEMIERADEIINKEKMEWERKKIIETEKMQNKIKMILSEVEATTKQISQENEKEFLEREKNMIKKIEQQSQALADEYKQNLEKGLRRNFNKKFMIFFQKQINDEAGLIIQDNMWDDFLKLVSLLNIDKVLLNAGKKEKHKKLKLVLMSAFPIKIKQEKELRKIIQLKTGIEKIILEKQVKPELLAGFNLILGGLLVEKNLKNELQKLVFNY